jgi:hypothetical protein
MVLKYSGEKIASVLNMYRFFLSFHYYIINIGGAVLGFELRASRQALYCLNPASSPSNNVV